MSLIASLFCPDCQEPYDDTDQRPRLGACGHTVCHQCIECSEENGGGKIVDCPICKETNAFSKVLYNFELCKVLEAFNEKVTEENLQWLEQNPQKLDIGVCKSCLTTERLRICVTCAKKARLFEKLPNGKFQILENNIVYHLANSVYFCSDCIADGQPDHPQHEFLQLSRVDVIKMDLEIWNYLIYATSLARKMKEERNLPTIDTAKAFKRNLLWFKKMALDYEVQMRSPQFKYFEDLFKFNYVDKVDINSIPELSRAKHRSFEVVQPVINRVLKLRERLLWCRRRTLNAHVEKMTSSKSADPVILRYKEELLTLPTKFQNLRLAELTQPEADRIDDELNVKVEQELQKLNDVFVNKKKYRIYQVVCSLIQNAVDNERILAGEMGKEIKSAQQFFEKRLGEVEKISNKTMAALAHRLFLFQYVERTFKYDEMLIKFLKSSCDKLEGLLIWELSFPKVFDYSEDYFYDVLLKDKFGEETIEFSGAFAGCFCVG